MYSSVLLTVQANLVWKYIAAKCTLEQPFTHLTALVQGNLNWFPEEYFIWLYPCCALCLIPKSRVIVVTREVILKACEVWLLSAWMLHQNVPFLVVCAPSPAPIVTTPILLLALNNYNLLNNADLWIILTNFFLQYCYRQYLALLMAFLTLNKTVPFSFLEQETSPSRKW